MNGKKSLISQKIQIGRYDIRSVMAITLPLAFLFLGGAVPQSPSPSPSPRNIAPITYEMPQSSIPHIQHIKDSLQQEATLQFYIDLVGSSDIVVDVLDAAKEHDITDEEVLFALMYQESRFIPSAINENATSIDRGLFQLNDAVYTDLPDDVFFDTEWNIATGVRHYAIELASAEGVHQYALHAYNAGPARRYDPPVSTQQYAIRVLETAQEYRQHKREYIDNYVSQRVALYIFDAR